MSSPMLLLAAAVVALCILVPVALFAFAIYGLVKAMEAME